MLGGFTTNCIWCVLLNIKNKSGYQYLATVARPEHAELVASGGDHGGGGAPPKIDKNDLRIPVLGNYLFSALAGTIWYFQFFFYSMGHIRMGGSDPEGFGFSSWTLHMASIIVFSTLWGVLFHEWKGSSKKTYTLIAAGILTLILSTIIIGYGTYLKGAPGAGH
jgi:L-rhamnose-H+ transport protein